MRLSGSITALATPFTVTGEIDFDAWRRLLQAQLDAGTEGIVVAGSTGEATTLYDVEYDALLRTAVEAVGGRIPVLAGTGLSGTARTVEQTRRAAALGADLALVVTPAYVRPTQAGLLAHFRQVSAEGGLPIVLYNVPGRTGCDLLPETVEALLACDGIVGIKEALGEPERMTALLSLRSEGFAVLGGDDATASRAMLAGADGAVSVVSNVVPRTFRALCDLSRSGRSDEAASLDAKLRGLYAFSGVESNPIPVKALLEYQGIGRGLRLPLQPLSDAHRAAASRIARDVEAIEQSCRDLVAA